MNLVKGDTMLTAPAIKGSDADISSCGDVLSSITASVFAPSTFPGDYPRAVVYREFLPDMLEIYGFFIYAKCAVINAVFNPAYAASGIHSGYADSRLPAYIKFFRSLILMDADSYG